MWNLRILEACTNLPSVSMTNFIEKGQPCRRWNVVIVIVIITIVIIIGTIVRANPVFFLVVPGRGWCITNKIQSSTYNIVVGFYQYFCPGLCLVEQALVLQSKSIPAQ